jgi:hypothetical protein
MEAKLCVFKKILAVDILKILTRYMEAAFLICSSVDAAQEKSVQKN